MARSASTIAGAFAGVALFAAAASAAPGETSPADVMAARRALMADIERLMKPIDSLTVGEPAELGALGSAARSIETMLRTAPHLFPSTTNRFDPSSAETPTLALPSVWQQWDTFVQLGAASVRAAADLAAADGAATAHAAALKLRGTCDACHAVFTRPYVPQGASDADRDFDFDSVLPQ
jgi:cytochrome c556